MNLNSVKLGFLLHVLGGNLSILFAVMQKSFYRIRISFIINDGKIFWTSQSPKSSNAY